MWVFGDYISEICSPLKRAHLATQKQPFLPVQQREKHTSVQWIVKALQLIKSPNTIILMFVHILISITLAFYHPLPVTSVLNLSLTQNTHRLEKNLPVKVALFWSSWPTDLHDNDTRDHEGGREDLGGRGKVLNTTPYSEISSARRGHVTLNHRGKRERRTWLICW